MTQIVETKHDGSIFHYKVSSTGKTKKLHREDGPAVIYPEGLYGGSHEWYINGIRHRTDGPAIIWGDGDYNYYNNGRLHRLDGPAVFRNAPKHAMPVHYSGRSLATDEYRFYVNDIKLHTESEYNKAVARWLSYREVTREDIKSKIGNFRIVEW